MLDFVDFYGVSWKPNSSECLKTDKNYSQLLLGIKARYDWKY